MTRIFDWEEEWEWENVDNSRPIRGQMSFFPPNFSFLKSEKDKNNNFSSFEDIIYKNPSLTIEDMQRFNALMEEMSD